MTIADILKALEGLPLDTEIGVWSNECCVTQEILSLDIEDAVKGEGHPVYIMIE